MEESALVKYTHKNVFQRELVLNPVPPVRYHLRD